MRMYRPLITGDKGVVTSGHYLATAAGLKMFAKGGNAIDAGVAAGFALCVLKPHENSLGGECPIMIYSPREKNVVSISGQGVAPRKASVKWFKENDIGMIPGDGLLAATIPGLFGAYCMALQKYGMLSLREVMEPAFALASKGFPVYEALRNSILHNQKRFREEWPSSAEIFLPGGKIPDVGQVLKQPRLAETFRKLIEAETCFLGNGREAAIEHSIDYFYKGDIAALALEFAKNTPVKDATGKYNTTLLEMDDFILYRTRVEDPVHVEYKNFTVYKCGPWTQGPVFLQQLKLLEGFELRDMKLNTEHYIHIVTECAKLAFADRETYYGDPRFSDVPLEKLFSREYNEAARNNIDLLHANNIRKWQASGVHGDMGYIGDTTHLDVIDDEGFMISATPSGGWIPSSPVIPSLGFPLGTRAQVFNLKEGHPNCIQPGKRPRTTLTPSIAFRDGKPWMAFGTQGGDMQDQWTLQFFLNIVEFGMNMQQAMDAPSFHTCHFSCSFYPHQVEEGVVFIEDGIDRDVLIKLQNMGHKLNLLPAGHNGQVCAVAINQKTGVLEGAASAKYDLQAYALGW